MLRWSVLCVGLLFWGCASMSPVGDFTFTPSTDETFTEVQEARLYRTGVGQPHRVIGEVMIQGDSDELEEFLENRLLEGARQVGAQGIIVIEKGNIVYSRGRAAIRHDRFGGASTRYRIYPDIFDIEEERVFVRGRAIRFIED